LDFPSIIFTRSNTKEEAQKGERKKKKKKSDNREVILMLNSYSIPSSGVSPGLKKKGLHKRKKEKRGKPADHRLPPGSPLNAESEKKKKKKERGQNTDVR